MNISQAVRAPKPAQRQEDDVPYAAQEQNHGPSTETPNLLHKATDQKCAENEIKDDSWFISNELSEGLVLFSSAEGRRIFFETESAGYLNSYFELAQNFLTSFEPFFGCGLATLTMCLNTFHADPGRVWKDIYRWYAQSMLEHCVPYRIIASNGLAFQQFACMAECNYLKVALVRNVKPAASMEEFRELCKRTTSKWRDEILVVCYHRSGVDQEGTGHFSPIGGYHPEKDLVLVFDISRYKYPLHWIPIKRLWEAMALDDVVTGNPRGYFLLQKRTSLEKPSLLFKTASLVDSPTHHRGWLKFFKTVLLPWQTWMQNLDACTFTDDVTLGDVIRKLLQLMMREQCKGVDHLDGIHIRLEFINADSSLRKKCLVCKVRETIEHSSLWKHAKEEIAVQQQEQEKKEQEQHKQLGQQKQQQQKHQENQEQEQQYSICLCWSKLINDVLEDDKPESTMCCDIDIQPSSCHLRCFNLVHYVVMILLSWPYDLEEKNNHQMNAGICSAMRTLVSTELSNLDGVLQEEILRTKNRFLNTRLFV